jgi:hypothetical protein
MKTITIKRSKWLNGDRECVSVLMDKNEHMCCLGFAIHQVTKCKKSRLLNLATPYKFFRGDSFLTDATPDGVNNNFLAMDAIVINDDKSILGLEREEKLRKLFKKNGYKLKFVD